MAPLWTFGPVDVGLVDLWMQHSWTFAATSSDLWMQDLWIVKQGSKGSQRRKRGVKGGYGPTEREPRMCSAEQGDLMPSIVEEQLESIRIDRSDPSRHSNLNSKMAARSAAIFFSNLCASRDLIDQF